MTRITLLGCCTIGLLTSVGAAIAAAPAAKPNFVVFLLDDMGWRDLGCYGSAYYETPHIDRLATQSMRFTDAYAACAVCSPTRASLLTGKYPARLHLTYILGGKNPPNTQLKVPDWTEHLPLEELTFAEALREGGYATAQIGKWHLGEGPYTPDKQGFERVVGAIPAKNRNDKDVEYFTDSAVEFIRAHRQQRFLLHLCHNSVHVPYQADPALVAKYRRKRESNGQNNPTMAAMIETLDQSVGRLLKTIDDLGLAENTVVIFTSDNGGLRWLREGKRIVTATCNAPFRAGKATLYEGGIRVPLIIKWPGVAPGGSTCPVPVISNDLYPTLLEMAGLPLRPTQHCDGLSLKPLLTGRGTLNREALYWHFPHYHSGTTPGGAIRAGNWKLIESYENDRAELYDLKDDPGESRDLAATQPEKAAQLRRMLQTWRTSVGAQMPSPNPNYRPAAAPPSRPIVELVADPAFRQGLIAKDRDGKEQPLRWQDAQKPAWRTAQHHSKSSLADARYIKFRDRGFTFHDDYQFVSLYPDDGEGDLVLGVNAYREYGGVYRKPGGPWPHLYVEQRISNPGGHLGEASPRVSQMERLDVTSRVRLLYDRPHTAPGYNPHVHAAQFLFFLTVQNLERQSKGYGDYFHFGISIYDSRRALTGLHAMRDKGSPEKKGTEKFIYDVGLAPFTADVVGAGGWVTVCGDLLPLIRAGLQESWKQGYLAGSTDPHDYRIGSVVIGWEIPGLNDAALALKDFSLTATLRKAAP